MGVSVAVIQYSVKNFGGLVKGTISQKNLRGKLKLIIGGYGMPKFCGENWVALKQ